jgi:hypothetical protein
MLWAEALALSLLLLARCRELFERKAISAVERPRCINQVHKGPLSGSDEASTVAV